MRANRVLFLAMIVAFAAFFMVIPQRGGDATVTMLPAPELAAQIAAERAWRFDPPSLKVDRGARIAFTNDSDITHTVTCSGCPWDTGDVQPGQTKFLTFDEDATYAYFCRYHGQELGMTASLTVGEGGPVREIEPAVGPPGDPGVPVP